MRCLFVCEGDQTPFCGVLTQIGGVAIHGLRAVCGASAQFVMVSNHGISVPFVIHVLVSFMLPFVIGLPPFVISGFLEMISRICVSPIFMIGIDMLANICGLVNVLKNMTFFSVL